MNQKDKVVYEIVANNEVTAVPSICKAPVFVTKFKYFRKEKCLGYVLNNVIGVVYADNDHVIGHNKKEFQYL